MRYHCCDDDSGCFAPDSDYNYENVDCDCDCERCLNSAEFRMSESVKRQMKEISYREPDTLEMRWDHTGEEDEMSDTIESYDDIDDDDYPLDRLSDEEMDRRSDARFDYEDELRSLEGDRFNENDDRPEFGLELDPNFDQDPDDLFSYGKTSEGVNFDKFIDRILISEGHNRQPAQQEDNPQRRRAAKRQDRPANRTVYRRTK